MAAPKYSPEQLKERAFHAKEALNHPVVKEALARLEKDAMERLLTADVADPKNALAAQAQAAAAREFKALLLREIKAAEQEDKPENVIGLPGHDDIGD